MSEPSELERAVDNLFAALGGGNDEQVETRKMAGVCAAFPEFPDALHNLAVARYGSGYADRVDDATRTPRLAIVRDGRP